MIRRSAGQPTVTASPDPTFDQSNVPALTPPGGGVLKYTFTDGSDGAPFQMGIGGTKWHYWTKQFADWRFDTIGVTSYNLKSIRLVGDNGSIDRQMYGAYGAANVGEITASGRPRQTIEDSGTTYGGVPYDRCYNRWMIGEQVLKWEPGGSGAYWSWLGDGYGDIRTGYNMDGLQLSNLAMPQKQGGWGSSAAGHYISYSAVIVDDSWCRVVACDSFHTRTNQSRRTRQ